MYIWYHIFRYMSSIVSINGLDKKTLSGYVVFSVEKQKKEIIFRNWQLFVKYLINIILLKQLLTSSVFYVIITT